jgi:K+-transporting ATPase ATPase C chain
LAFPFQADGSLIELDGKVIGSALIGQRFTQPGSFHGRPSAAGTDGYDMTASGGTNLSATSKPLLADITARATAARADYPPGAAPPVPIDLVTSSGSGLDPDLSPAAALYQVPRVAHARGIDPDQLRMLIGLLVENRTLGVLGEPRVNLLKLNLAVNELSKGLAAH